MSTIFLDRDGVINENRPDYVKSWDEFSFLPGSREAIADLTRAHHRIVVCTNQAGVARGSLSTATIEDIHRHMRAEVAMFGGEIEKIYYCPHLKEEGCLCRKPQPGMLLQACDDLHITIDDAVFIGDSISDMHAGFAAGIPTMLVLTGRGVEEFRNHRHEVRKPFQVAINLQHATEIILQRVKVFSRKGVS